MRRKNREVTDMNEILDILRCCDTIRLGLTGADGPYVVPVSFGLDLSGEKPVVYFHCARKGILVPKDGVPRVVGAVCRPDCVKLKWAHGRLAPARFYQVVRVAPLGFAASTSMGSITHC